MPTYDAYYRGPNSLHAGSTGDVRLELWISRRQRSQELKQLFEADWTRYWRWYRNVVDPLTDPAEWWRSNESIPTVFKIVETLLPRYLIGMFSSPDWFSVEARNARSEQYERVVEALLKATVEEMQLFPKMYEALKYALIMGHCWGKIVWRETYTERQVLRPSIVTDPETGMDVMGVETEVVTEADYNNVDFDWVTLDRVFPDPTGDNEWFIEEIDTTLEKLEEVQRHLKVYDKGEFQRLIDGIPPAMNRGGGGDSLSDARSGTSAGVSVEYAREPQVTEGIPNHITTPMRDGLGVKIWQCWGWVPKECRTKDDSAWRLVVIAEGKYVLRDEPSPTPDGKPPYFGIKSIPIPKRLYGESILKYIGPLADQQTRLSNMRLDEVFLNIWKQYLYRANCVVSDNQLLMQPGGAIQVQPEQGQSINDVFSVLPREPVLPDAYNEDQYRQTQAEHAAAASDIMQGVSTNDRQTATEVERRVQQGNARHTLYTMWNDYTVKKELLERTWKWLQMRMTVPRVVRTVGEEYATIDISQIQIPVDIVVSGGLFALSKDTRVQMDQELVQLAGSPVFGPYFKPYEVIRRLLLDRGWQDPGRYLKTEEEVALEQALMQAVQSGQLQQAASGMANGEGAGGGLQGLLGGLQGGGQGGPSAGGGSNGPPGMGPKRPMPNVPRQGEGASLGGGIISSRGIPPADTGI